MYPLDRRYVASHVYSLFQSLRKTAILLQVSHSTISRWLKSPERKLYKRKCPKQTPHVVETIRCALQNDPFLECSGLCTIVKVCTGIAISRSLVHTAIKKSGMTRKKARMCGAPKSLQAKTEDFICNTRQKEGHLLPSTKPRAVHRGPEPNQPTGRTSANLNMHQQSSRAEFGRALHSTSTQYWKTMTAHNSRVDRLDRQPDFLTTSEP
jgi:transposase